MQRNMVRVFTVFLLEALADYRPDQQAALQTKLLEIDLNTNAQQVLRGREYRFGSPGRMTGQQAALQPQVMGVTLLPSLQCRAVCWGGRECGMEGVWDGG